MDRITIISSLLVFLALPGFSLSTTVNGTGEACVEAGQTQALGNAVLSEGSVLVKDGTGTLTASMADVRGPNGAVLAQGNGTMVLTLNANGGSPSAAVLPELSAAIRQKLALWLDASQYATRPELFPGDGGVTVRKWFDARETSVTAPTYYYAQANFTTNFTSALPEMKTCGTSAAVYFGGYGSGRYLDVMKNGANTTIGNVCHVFAVHSISNSWGWLFGPSLHINGWQNAAASLANPWWLNNVQSQWSNGRFFVNGRQVDGLVEKPLVSGASLQLFEFDLARQNISIPHIYRCNQHFAADVGYRAGGDYISEMLVFTKRLNPSEAAVVNEYLVRKWGLGTNPAVGVAKGAALTIMGISAEPQDTVFAGSGEVVKNDSGALALRGVSANFGGSLDVQSGSVDLVSPMSVKARAGDRLTASKSDVGPRVSVDANAVASDALVKSGEEELHVSSIPAGIQKMQIEGGVVHFDTSATNMQFAAGDYPEVVIPNASFEDWTLSTTWQEELSTSAVKDGWSSLGGVTKFVDYERWVWHVDKQYDAGSGQDGWGRDVWSLSSLPPDGVRCLFLRNQGSGAYTTVEIPYVGDYQLTLQMASREMNGQGFPISVLLMTTDGTQTVASFGRLITSSSNGFHPVRLVAKDVPSGRYRLAFKPDYTSGDRAMLLDDLHLCRIPACRDGSCPVPGGDFESVDTSGSFYTFNAANTVPNWTFVQPKAASSTKIGASCYYHGVAYWNDATRWDNGFIQLASSLGVGETCQAKTTFEAPVGKWYVRADLARNDGTPGVSLSAKVGETAVSLGKVVPASTKLTPCYWAVPLVVTEENRQVELTFTFASENAASTATALMDNVVLSVRPLADGAELLTNGSFESTLASWTQVDPDGKDSASYVLSYEGQNEAQITAFGKTPPPNGGTRRAVVRNRGILTQSVTFPDDDWYEVSWWSHMRLDQNRATGVSVWLSRTDSESRVVTNLLGAASTLSKSFARHAFLFRPPVAGVYTFGIGGNVSGYVGDEKKQNEQLIDCISIKSVTSLREDGLGELTDLEVNVEASARLALGFEGSKAVRKVRYAGRSYSGVISSETHPEFVSGPGSLVVPRKGLCVIVR